MVEVQGKVTPTMRKEAQELDKNINKVVQYVKVGKKNKTIRSGKFGLKMSGSNCIDLLLLINLWTCFAWILPPQIQKDGKENVLIIVDAFSKCTVAVVTSGLTSKQKQLPKPW